MVVYSSPLITHVPLSSVTSGATVLTRASLFPICSIIQSPSVCPLVAVPLFEQTNEQSVWHQIFEKFFSRFLPHTWKFIQVYSKPPGFTHTFVDSAKVRFCCEACGHGWTSMKGRVTFWCCLIGTSGFVTIRLYGQQCDRCRGDNYEIPLWYPEEISKVLSNISDRIAHAFYGCCAPAIRFKRRHGKPKTSHNSQRCQACKDGVCALRR